MTSSFLYSGDPNQDLVNILSFINEYTKKAGILTVGIDEDKVRAVIQIINNEKEFPCVNGLSNASIFKKVAYFVCCFSAYQPLVNKFPEAIIGEDLYRISNHQNAMLAFFIAEHCLLNAKIFKASDVGVDLPCSLSNSIEYSKHSLIDIIEAIADSGTSHFKLMTIFFEQLAYKTNPHCQYSVNLINLPNPIDVDLWPECP